jgi:hypothetical protein
VQHSDRPCVPPSLLYNGYCVSSQGLKRPRRGFDHPPHLAPMLKKEHRRNSNFIFLTFFVRVSGCKVPTYVCKYGGISGNAIQLHATYKYSEGRLHSCINDSFHLIVPVSLAQFGHFSYRRTSFPVLC